MTPLSEDPRHLPLSGTTATIPLDLLDWLEHDSWRCLHPPHFYFATPDVIAEGRCPCGLVDALHDAGLHDLADRYDMRKQATDAE